MYPKLRASRTQNETKFLLPVDDRNIYTERQGRKRSGRGPDENVKEAQKEKD